MGHKYSVLRCPRTTQELRENHCPENEVFVRSKRKRRYLPNAYDDIFINGSGKRFKCWKTKKTKKQYKIIAN